MTAVHVYHEHASWIGDALRARGMEVVEHSDAKTFADAVAQIEILVTQRPPRELLSRARRLRLLHGLGAGVDDLFPSAIPDTVTICCARGVMAAEVSEHALMLMLALERSFPALLERQRAHEWKMFGMGKLEGKTVGIVGLGAIGQRIARITRALGMRVIGCNRSGRAIDGIEVVPLDRMVADHVVVCAPRTPDTLSLIDSTFLSRQPRGAYVISVGRGGIVDETALFDALSAGHIGGAGLDVFDDEPLPPNSRWWRAPNTIVTPHIAGYGRHYLERIIAAVVANIERFDRGEPVEGRVDGTHGY
jgi:D-2-hydroxyacid dehydrogenase (NADP+)